MTFLSQQSPPKAESKKPSAVSFHGGQSRKTRMLSSCIFTETFLLYHRDLKLMGNPRKWSQCNQVSNGASLLHSYSPQSWKPAEFYNRKIPQDTPQKAFRPNTSVHLNEDLLPNCLYLNILFSTWTAFKRSTLCSGPSWKRPRQNKCPTPS